MSSGESASGLPEGQANASRRPMWYGIITFCAVMVFLVAVPYVLPATGVEGLYLTGAAEIGLLLLALAGWRLSGRPFRDVFPVKKPTARSLRGGLLIWLGTYCITIGTSFVMMRWFPQMTEVSEGIGQTIGSVPFWAGVAMAAVMPAVCEEAVHRGVILSSLDRVKGIWPRLMIMGVFFGLFHMDIYRFLPTAILGMGLTYMAVKSGNLLLPMLFHFVNNMLSVLAVGALDTVDSSAVDAAAEFQTMETAWGSCLFYGGIAVLLLFFGVRQMNPRPEKQNGQTRLAVAVSILLLISGCSVISLTMDMDAASPAVGSVAALVEERRTLSGGQAESGEHDFQIEADGARALQVSVQNMTADIEIRDESGEVAFEKAGITDSYVATVSLSSGKHTLVYRMDAGGVSGETEASFRVTITGIP